MKSYNRNISLDSDVEMSGDEGCLDSYNTMLYHAEKEDRLTKGVFECAHVLETYPEVVEICILPMNQSSDTSVQIQHVLIQAYCWENDIQVVKLDTNQFNQIAKSSSRTKGSDLAQVAPVECIIVSSKPLSELPDIDVNIDHCEQFG